MSTLRELAERMRKDWDRRVAHDYRFWMSDGYRDDQHMWETGERDLAIIAAGIEGGGDKTALEIGCGVGRMLRSAGDRFGKVIGFDVSSCAIERARSLLGDPKNIELVLGSGVDLSPLPDSSVDFVWSFAAITSMPVKVIASYLREIRRVLKPGGAVRFQVYLGEEMLVSEDDTLHLRCFTMENFTRGVELAGFRLAERRELILPIQVSFRELGIEAFIVSLVSNDGAVASESDIAAALLPKGEHTGKGELDPADLEAWMAKNYAEQLVSEGDVQRARETLEYVHSVQRSSTIDTTDLLNRIVDSASGGTGQKSALPERVEASLADPATLDRNVDVLKSRFGEIFERVAPLLSSTLGDISIKDSAQGPSIWLKQTCLDHAEKPRSGGDAWATRTLQETRVGAASDLVIVGFGGGYHLEAILAKTSKEISCIEPNPLVFVAALRSRDLTSLLRKLKNLVVGEDVPASIASATAELVVRPQSLVTDSAFVAQARGVFYSRRGLALLKPKIAVLGPMQGGTQPIGQYTYNSLIRLGQRTRGLDMSGFNSGFELLDGFVHHAPRKNVLHGAYVEMLSTVILEAFTEKPVDVLICMAQAPITPRVLTELRKRGVITVLWFVEDYLRFTYWREVAQYYDFIFTIQKDECIDAIKKAGAGEVHYLPTAADPSFHVPMSLSQDDIKRWGSPISFVGAGYHNRQQMFASFANMPFKIWGSEWPKCKPFDRLVQDDARRIPPEEYIKIFNATTININLHSSTERDGVDPSGDFLNPRTFELASCGAFQLVDERAYLADCFEVGKEIITFNSVGDLREKIAYYMDRPEERAEIAQRARARVLKEHTYQHRIEKMLSIIYASKFDTLRSREQASPWAKMLERAKPHEELNERCVKAHERGEEPVLDALISDIVTGKGKLSETEQKLLFLFHVRKQIIRMTREESGQKGPG